MNTPSIQGKITAAIQAVLRGNERSLFVLGLLAVAVLALSLWRIVVTPWAIPGIIVSLGMLIVLLLAWLRDSGRFGQANVPFTLIQQGQDLALSTEIEPRRAAQVLAAIRETIQNRQPLPNPHGNVTGNPTDDRALRAYDVAESNDVGQRIRTDADEHSREVTSQIIQAQRSLTALAPESAGESYPIPTPRPGED